MPALSIVMPAYNEEASIDRAIGEVVREVFKVVPDAELVVVDDGSRDATAERVRAWAAHDLRVRLVSRSNGGHGAALMTGAGAAKGARLLFVDSDAQIALADFASTWSLAQDADAVLGVRVRRHDPLHRLVLTRMLRALLAWRYRVGFADANVPYKLVARAWIDRLATVAPERPLVPSILLALVLARGGARVIEQPIVHRPRTGGVGSLRAGKLARFCVRAWREVERTARTLPATPP